MAVLACRGMSPRCGFLELANTNFDVITRPFCHENKRRRDFRRACTNRLQSPDGEFSSNVTRPQIENTDKFSPQQYQPAEIAVMGQNDSTSLGCLFQNVRVRAPKLSLLGDGFNIKSLLPQKRNYFWMDVFICQQGEIERIHAPTFTSNSTSFLTDCAAYFKASSTASAVNCG